ncbi:Kelch repeat-containing protein [Limisalsivibrio acetivorans]|uniref:Kelch repeat-containing protein n=1 Tax=Limisalsivibrio acetivorans TaxID=1304888 RepID=UPI0003B64C1D|nr:kelch repeat-containing protein [Limisalsivibrio acetivorans]
MSIIKAPAGGGTFRYIKKKDYDPVKHILFDLSTLGLSAGNLHNYAWQKNGSVPTTAPHPLAASVNDKYYHIRQATGDLEEYDPQTGVWAIRASMPSPSDGCAACALGDKIYVSGGFDDRNAMRIYDTSTDTWTINSTALDKMRMEHTMAAGSDGRLYLFGHYHLDAEDINNTVYDPTTDTSSAIAPLPISSDIRYSAAVSIGDDIYIVGGEGSSNSSLYAYVWRYAPTSDTYETVSAMPGAKYQHALVAVSGKLIAIGGVSTSDVYEYDPAGDRWIKASSLVSAGTEHAAAVIADRIYMTDSSGSFYEHDSERNILVMEVA